jgi:hypothetical protein
MRYVWDSDAWADYLYWQTQDRRVVKRINELIKDIARGPQARAARVLVPANHRRAPPRLQGGWRRDPHRRLPLPLRHLIQPVTDRVGILATSVIADSSCTSAVPIEPGALTRRRRGR